MKNKLWLVIAIVVIAVGYWLWNSKWQVGTEGLPQLPAVSEEDTAARIQQNLEQIDLGDIDQQFESIDAELNNL
ncbi:MAG: hypothetical protein HYS78_00460 [Parcubacteria group bacterium]|nr:hypothetical protein [Parcubacteria group bacterium]